MQKDQELYLNKTSFIHFRNECILDHYEFCPRALGNGSYGVVYRAKKKGANGPWRAVKKFVKKNIKNLNSIKNEIANLSQLDHPGIIKLYETYEDDKYLFLVTDICEGGELFHRLEKQGPFSEKDARIIFVQIIEALSYCHKNHIVHRDLKLENFMFLHPHSLNVKLIDFGFSYKWKKNLKIQLKKKQETNIVGTSGYIAPEVIAGQYDEKCDIWSAGVILYVLVTASLPFTGSDEKQIISAIKKGTYSMNSDQMKKISKECKCLITQILQPDYKRISIEKIFEHPWMKMSIPAPSLKVDINKMHNFSKFSKLKKISATYIASKFSEKEVENLGILFKQIDKNHDGLISIEELKESLEKQKNNHSDQELKQIMEAVDTDKNGMINYTEFIASLMEEEKISKKQNIINVFEMIDRDRNGIIDKGELKQILQKNNLSSIKEEELENIMESCDKNKDGIIDLNEFIAAMMI